MAGDRTYRPSQSPASDDVDAVSDDDRAGPSKRRPTGKSREHGADEVSYLGQRFRAAVTVHSGVRARLSMVTNDNRSPADKHGKECTKDLGMWCKKTKEEGCRLL